MRNIYNKIDNENMIFFPYSVAMQDNNIIQTMYVASWGKTLNPVFLLTLIRKYKTTDQLFNT